MDIRKVEKLIEPLEESGIAEIEISGSAKSPCGSADNTAHRDADRSRRRCMRRP